MQSPLDIPEKRKITRFLAVLAVLSVVACQPGQETNNNSTISQVMDSVITRLYQEVPPEKYASISEASMRRFLSAEEKKVLATKYWHFNVNVPVVVSLMRHKEQAVVPFWLPESGFVKTSLEVKNEEYSYEVWQKKFDRGKVGLGINGLELHRPVYFISVEPQNSQDSLSITDVHPADHRIDTMKAGALIYQDWTELVLTEVPPSLVGQKLFTTIRGRAREAHVVGGFRNTPFPSSAKPDQVMLTWSDSPKTSMDIQWRTNPTLNEEVVRYWMADEKGKTDTNRVQAERDALQDRMLANDRYINRFTARLKHLASGRKYGYQIGSSKDNRWSDAAFFETETATPQPFSFVWFGDSHHSPDWGKLLQRAYARHPEAAFYSIAGDLVSTGLYRDEWDQLFGYAGRVFSAKPLMPVLGNHDKQDGLGAGMYYALFSLPKNGPTDVEPEAAYSFEYGNALFVMLDVTSPSAAHNQWIEETLAHSQATWKFVMFHFAPYNFEEPYPDIQQAWVPLFDKYHVDVVMNGHIHYYMRSRPMFGGKVVDSFDKGTVYATSIGIPVKHADIGQEAYAAVRYKEGYFYQHMQMDAHTLKYKVFDSEGQLKDEFVIRK